jgi:erythronate-4-phosphate dehydrogenase
MHILADQNIPFARQAFAAFGDVKTFVGRDLSAQDVRSADILLVRSVTRVNAALLEKSNVRFVGSATIGTDHIDLEYLRQRGIQFANAPGSNATSAAEYVIAALLFYVQQRQVELGTLRFGIVGYGNVGSRVVKRLHALGLQTEVYDPPRQQSHNDITYCDWQTICDCDVVTAHVPLTRDGDYPTWRMFSDSFFRALRPGALFINTARGAAVDEAALHTRLQSKNSIDLILDVWQNEPRIDHALVSQTLLSTPHIAGYAYDGKLRGTEMIYREACKYFDRPPIWTMDTELPNIKTTLTPDLKGNWLATLHALVRQVYDIEQDSQALRQCLQMDGEQAARHFDLLRKNYPKRLEFPNYLIEAKMLSEQQKNSLQQLGFGLV